MNDVSFALAFAAGFMSFLSPCVLPLVPVYISLVSGLSIDELRHSKFALKTFMNTGAFIAGFSTIFITLGASSSLIGQLLLEYQTTFRIAGGVLTILFGFFLTGLLRLDFLMKEKRPHIHKGTGLIGAFLIGISFSAGWTPCIGPILGTILIYAGTHASASYGLKLLAIYSLGLAIPFVVASLAINLFFAYTRKLDKFMRMINLVSGIILIIFGVLLLTDSLGVIISLLTNSKYKLL
jgi:cytochrome c-type biogenesis protein